MDIEVLEIGKRENASQIDETLANRLLSGKIFPIDEGDAEQGFDDLCSGAGDMEWYIADRPHLRDSFRGVVSLLSFSPAEILTIMPLITALGFEDRLLSKRTASNLITRGDVHLHEEHTATFRAKSKFIGRLLPKPITSLGEQILAALDNLKVFVADEVLLEWTLTSNDEQKADRTAKSRHHDDGIQAAVLPPAGEKGIEFYLKSGSDSCLPLDVARRLANICGIEEQANLIYFIFSERNFSYIERYLDRQGLLALTKEVDGNRDNTEYDTGPAEEDFGDMDNAIPPLVDEPADGGENKLKDGESATSDPQQKPGTGQQTPTATDSAEKVEGANNMKQHVEGTDSAIDSQQAIRIGEEAAMDGSSMNKSYHPPPDEVAPPRPCYSWLGDHLEVPSAAALPRSVPNQPIPRTRVVNDAQRLTVLERPRIVGKPNVMFVSNPQELPREDFSEMAPGGNILPGRAQIDQSGSCTIIIATNPDTRNDSDAAFIGELFVSKLLEHHLGSAYHPETHWTSHLRKRAGHTPLGLPEYAAATFTLADMLAMTEFLIRASFKEAMLWREETPVYHIQVQTTVGGQDSPFILNATNFEMIRRLKIPDPYLELPKEVFILVRVSDICASSSAFFYVDPWTIRT
ncbi:hypothetical protein THARTR1_04885 [Trichoderma harzianum]|uniref:Uncharacterized protein n=1 Tax=Trichoderma harzianum TaxID=5544 RepID=A0A2K0UA68_TRIHA|nr:hypothetical protein THARTR1_04885 [Trichoderma harzianum]